MCLLPFFRYEIRSTTVLFLQLCYSTFLMFFVSQKILNCFMTVWTELCRFFNTCKCYFFIILAWFIEHLTQILGTFVCHLALWFFPSTCVWCHFHECVYLKTIKIILSGGDTVWWHLAYFYYCIIYEYFFFTIESTSVKILKVFDHIKFCEATDFSSFCCDIGLRKYSRHILRTVCTHFFFFHVCVI